MEPRKTYGQFCALARALDHVGDRWTMLIIRELLIESRSFRQLQDALPGLSPNVLVQRLRALTDDGLVDRNDAPARSKSVTYTLSPAGAALEAAVFELIRWGARWMPAGPGADHVDAAWGLLAVKALLHNTPVTTRRRLTVHVRIGDRDLTIATAGGLRTVLTESPREPHAAISVELPALLAVAAGFAPVDAVSEGVDGDAAAVVEVFQQVDGGQGQAVMSRRAAGSSSRSSLAR